MKFFLKFLIVMSGFWVTGQFCHHLTDGFQLTKVTSDLQPNPAWETPVPSEQFMDSLKAIFEQPFSYLDCGGQCYAFLSQDHKVVLKLYKMHHLRQYSFLHHLALPGVLDRLRTHFLRLQKEKLHTIFSSSHLAYTELKQESGLLFLNLNPSLQDLQVTLIDKIGIVHHVNLAHIPFALQYRADQPFNMLRLHLLHRDTHAGKQVIKEIVECLTKRYDKGIKDLDPALRRNIGLLKDRAIAIDIGSFVSDLSLTNENKKQELIKDTRRMRRWLNKRSPEWGKYLDELIAQYDGTLESISQKWE
jgi:hypothetical protein